MTFNLTSPTRSRSFSEDLKTLLESIRRQIDSGSIKSIAEANSAAMAAFKDFYLNIGEPRIEFNKFEEGIPPSSVLYNKTMSDIQKNISNMYKEIESLHIAQTESFNYSETVFSELNNRTSEASSKIVDLNILNGLANQEVLVGTDNFSNLDYIDINYPLQNPLSDVLTTANMVVLKRVNTVNVVDQNIKVKVVPIMPVDLSTVPTQENERRFYEGNYFNYAGQARPEGGRWHLETFIREDKSADSVDINFRLVGGENKKNRPNTVGSIDQLQNELDKITPEPDPTNYVIIDMGANDAEKNAVRTKMLDGSPESFWEGEYSITIDTPLIDKDAILNQGDDADDGSNQPSTVQIDISPDELRQKTLALDVEDFIVEITVDLNDEKFINFITLNPFNFSEFSWLDVISIETASSDEDFQSIPGFNDGSYDNTITTEANEFLNDTKQSFLLAPNKFAYKGKGVWSFPAKLVKLVRMKIRQKVPIPAPYHKMHILMNRVIQKNKVNQSSDSGMF